MSPEEDDHVKKTRGINKNHCFCTFYNKLIDVKIHNWEESFVER